MDSTLIAKGSYIKIDDMVWPNPASTRHNEVEHKLRYHQQELTREDCLLAASIISAYQELVMNKKQVDRNKLCSAMIKAIKDA